MHKLLVISIFRPPLVVVQILLGYTAMLFISLLLLTAPLFIVILFPVFAYRRRRMIDKEAAKL